MRDRQEFSELLAKKWLPLREKQEQERDAAYFSLQTAARKLRGAETVADIPNNQIREGLAKVMNEPHTNTTDSEFEAAAVLLDEALALNESQSRTSPAVECLLVSAFLDPGIVASMNRKPVERVLMQRLSTTPISPTRCEDFSFPRKPFYWTTLQDDIRSSLNRRELHPLRDATPLNLVKGVSCRRSIARPSHAWSSPPPAAPARVQRMGPQMAEAVLNSIGAMVLNVAEGAQANAEFTREVERLVQQTFSAGCSPTLFDLTGNESPDEEAAKYIVDHVAQHLLTRIVRQESGFFLVLETAVGRFGLVQLRGPLRISVHRAQLSDIDNANGLLWSGGLKISFNSAGRVGWGGRWGRWEQMTGEVENYTIARGSPMWTIDWLGQTRFHRPSVRQIKDAFRGQ